MDGKAYEVGRIYEASVPGLGFISYKVVAKKNGGVQVELPVGSGKIVALDRFLPPGPMAQWDSQQQV